MWPAILQGMAAIAGPAIGGLLQYRGAQEANAASAGSVDRQIEFQRSQTSTQYQRGVEDLRAAGLNPILAATSGMSAGTAGGASYAAQNPAGGLASTAADAMSALNSLRKQDAEVGAIKASANASDGAAAASFASASKIAAEEGNVSLAGDFLKAQKAAADSAARYSGLQGDALLPSALRGRMIARGAKYMAKVYSDSVATPNPDSTPVPSPTPYRSPTPTRPW